MTENFSYIGHYVDESLTRRHFLSVVTRANIVNRRLKSRVRIMANIDERGLYDRIDWLRVTDRTKVYLLDEAGTVICAASEEELGKPLDVAVGFGIEPESLADVHRLPVPAGGMHLVVQRRNELTGWRFVVLLPERELLREQRTVLALTTLLVSVASLVLAFLASRIVGRTIRRPSPASWDSWSARNGRRSASASSIVAATNSATSSTASTTWWRARADSWTTSSASTG